MEAPNSTAGVVKEVQDILSNVAAATEGGSDGLEAGPGPREAAAAAAAAASAAASAAALRAMAGVSSAREAVATLTAGWGQKINTAVQTAGSGRLMRRGSSESGGIPMPTPTAASPAAAAPPPAAAAPPPAAAAPPPAAPAPVAGAIDGAASVRRRSDTR